MNKILCTTTVTWNLDFISTEGVVGRLLMLLGFRELEPDIFEHVYTINIFTHLRTKCNSSTTNHVQDIQYSTTRHHICLSACKKRVKRLGAHTMNSFSYICRQLKHQICSQQKGIFYILGSKNHSQFVGLEAWYYFKAGILAVSMV